jgi:hypothetical protein
VTTLAVSTAPVALAARGRVAPTFFTLAPGASLVLVAGFAWPNALRT